MIIKSGHHHHHHHHNCCNKQKVKRGLWSPEEDEILKNFISTYGHGCWSTVPTLAGLQRCGKSCRLRWINYLRPNLKRGNFTPQEAALIIELHRILGNKWSQMAKHLPGRTDNEVKNFWNSSIKKKLLPHHLKNINSSNHHQNSTLISPNHLPNSSNANTISSDQNFILMNPNNNLIIPNNQIHQMDHQMNPNPPIQPSIPIQGFDPIIEPRLDHHHHQMMNYYSNLAPIMPSLAPIMPNLAPIMLAPPSIPVSMDDSSGSNFPSWPNPPLLNKPIKQDYDHDEDEEEEEDGDYFGFGFENPNNPMFMNIKSEPSETLIYDHDHDSAMLDALMPEMSEIAAKGVEIRVSSPVIREHVLSYDPIGSIAESTIPSETAHDLHPNHIKNIASRMATFTSPSPPCSGCFHSAAVAYCGGSFVGRSSTGPSTWGRQP